MRTATWRLSGLSAGAFVEITNLYLLVIATLRAGEGPDLPGTEGGDDGRLVPVEDVAALLALLPEGHHRAPLVDDHTTRHLYSHVSRPSENLSINHRDTRAILPETRRLLAAGENLYLVALILQHDLWYIILNHDGGGSGAGFGRWLSYCASPGNSSCSWTGTGGRTAAGGAGRTWPTPPAAS